MSDSEFGPWIAHDGSGCPVPVGTVVHALFAIPNPEGKLDGVLSVKGGPSWYWGSVSDKDTWSNRPDGVVGKAVPIIRYRIKKPRGLTLLEEILKEVNDTNPLKVKRFKEESLP